MYLRLLKYGGARILPMTLPFTAGHIYEITYVIMDTVYTDLVDQLLEYGVLCLSDTFILDTILKVRFSRGIYFNTYFKSNTI